MKSFGLIILIAGTLYTSTGFCQQDHPKEAAGTKENTQRKQPPKQGKQKEQPVPIKEVPKANNHQKAKIVAPPQKIKPVKIIKPKINGKGFGR